MKIVAYKINSDILTIAAYNAIARMLSTGDTYVFLPWDIKNAVPLAKIEPDAIFVDYDEENNKFFQVK